MRRFVVLKELIQELIKQEKQAYEQLIRLISHEINNSIGAINSMLGSFQHYAPQLAPADRLNFTEALDVSMARNTQLASLIADFACLVRLPTSYLTPTDVHTFLRNLGHLLGPQSAARRMAWHWELTDAPLIIEASAPQLEQALLNVVKNVLEAIGEDGNIWVRTTDNPFIISIENDGPPLTSEVRERLFMTFFNTKRGG